MTGVVTIEDRHLQRGLDDTGYMCRHFLGYNYDIGPDNARINVGTGGVRATGPHQEIVEFVDDESIRNKHFQAPRGTLKTTLLSGFCIRKIARDRNIRIAYGMKSTLIAAEKYGAIRDQLENNQRLIEAYGEFLPRGCYNSNAGCTVAGRTVRGMAEPTITLFGVNKPLTGGHYDIIICDDLVDWDNITADGIERVMTCFRMCRPLLVNGGIMIVVGTRYDDADLYGTIMSDYKHRFSILVLDAGVEPVRQPNGTLKIEGQSKFGGLTNERLQEELDIMEYRDFCSQYLNRIVVGTSQPFRREHFDVVRWEEWMGDLSVYIVTDTSASEEEKNADNCYGVVGAVGIDDRDHFYLLDLRMGFFTPPDWEREFWSVHQTWAPRAWLRGVPFERNAMNIVYRANLESEARKRGIVLNFIPIKRGTGEPSKVRRIRSLQQPFENGRFHVLNTVKGTFVHISQIKTLFDPEGFEDPDTGHLLPAGEIVNQFIRFPRYPKRDGPDAIADILAVDEKGNRLCYYVPPRHSRRQRSRRPKAVGQVVDFPLTGLPGEGGVGDHWEEKYRRLFG